MKRSPRDRPRVGAAVRLTRKQASMRLVVLGSRRVRSARRAIFEWFDSARYSRAGLDDLDRKLEPYLADGGFFVEAGANDGYRKSNTYYLERFRGWRGVLVEPIPALAREAQRRRPNSRVYGCALVADATQTPQIRMRYADMLSAVTSMGSGGPSTPWAWDVPYELTVPTRTLTGILDEVQPPQVDLLSLDVEGYEAQVLAGVDFDRWAPSLMLVEIHDDDARQKVEAVLAGRYELVEWLTAGDALYRLKPG